MRLGIVRSLLLSIVAAAGCAPAGGAPESGHPAGSHRTVESGQGSWPRGTIVINEVYRGPHKLSGWIELASRGNTAVDLGGWFVTDKTDRLDHYYQFPPGSRIEPNARLLVRADGGQAGIGHHAPFSLSRTDAVYLLNRRGLLEDSLSYHLVDKSRALARIPDHEGLFVPAQPTPGASNERGLP